MRFGKTVENIEDEERPEKSDSGNGSKIGKTLIQRSWAISWKAFCDAMLEEMIGMTSSHLVKN